MPARKQPSDTVRTVLRLREGVRQRVEREARKNQCSLNMEMARRIEQSLEAGPVKSIEAVATELPGTWASWKTQERAIRQMCEAWMEKGRREKASA
jgi:hypothetical protein